MGESDDKSFGALLKRLRLGAGLTQQGLADRSGVSAKAVSDLERDPARTPRLDSVALLADALRLDADDRSRLLRAARPERDGSPPGTAVRPIGRLPVPQNPLLGRNGVVASLVTLVRQGTYRLVTLTGPGGVGKTRVASRVAAEVAGAFPDGVVFVDLTSIRDADLVVATLARALDVADQQPMSLWERLVAVLADRRILLVIDNFEHVLTARKVVLELLATCPWITVLVTSRVSLELRDEREYRIAPLPLREEGDGDPVSPRAPGEILFRERARAAGVDLAVDAASVSAIAAICRRLDGLPLAIELAAAQAPLLGPAAMLARMERHQPLPARAPQDLPKRQRTMHDIVAWSYDLLTVGEQRLFRSVCVFAGGFDAAAAAAVSRFQDEEVLEVLGALVAKNMVRRIGDDFHDPESGLRFDLFETIREFGLQRLDSAEELEPVRARHAAHYADVAEAAGLGRLGGEVATATANIAREQDNLRAALDHALDAGDADTALRIAGAAWPFWLAQGHLAEGRRWIDRALRLAGPATPGPMAARALAGAAALAVEQGDLVEAVTLTAWADEAARDADDRRSLLTALLAHGLIARQGSEHDRAVRSYEEALQLAGELDDPASTVTALIGLSYVATFVGDLDRAEDLAQQALRAARRLSSPRARADVLQLSTWHAFHRGHWARVDEIGEEALTLYRDLGETGEVAEMLRLLGTSAGATSRYERGSELLSESMMLRRLRGDEFRAAIAGGVLAQVELNLGHLEQARVLAEEVLEIAYRYDNPWSIAMALLLLGHTASALGEADRAFDLLTASAALMGAMGNTLYLVWCAEGLIGVLVAQQEWDAADHLRALCEALPPEGGSRLPPLHPAAFARSAAALADHRDRSPAPVSDPAAIQRLLTAIEELRPVERNDQGGLGAAGLSAPATPPDAGR